MKKIIIYLNTILLLTIVLCNYIGFSWSLIHVFYILSTFLESIGPFHWPRPIPYEIMRLFSIFLGGNIFISGVGINLLVINFGLVNFKELKLFYFKALSGLLIMLSPVILTIALYVKFLFLEQYFPLLLNLDFDIRLLWGWVFLLLCCLIIVTKYLFQKNQ